ncbi:tensin 3-2 [Festucalex cinctus]
MSEDESCSGPAMTAESSPSERETDILEDEDDDDEANSSSDAPRHTCSLPTENLPAESRLSEFNHGGIRQEIESIKTMISNGECGSDKTSSSSFAAPRTPSRGRSSEEAVQRGLLGNVPQNSDTFDTMQSARRTNETSAQEAEFASLSVDIDDSIEQLNRLILDLDPTFVPVPTGCAPLSRSASVQSAGLSDQGNTHLIGWKRQKQISDVTDHSGRRTGFYGLGDGPESLGDHLLGAPPHLSSQNTFNCADDGGQRGSFERVPPTPSFPLSPPTPYAETISAFSPMGTVGQWSQHSWTQDSRSFLDSANHTGTSVDGELFRSDASVSSASCPRTFGSMCSVSSSSPVPHMDSSTPPPAWQQQQTSASSQPSTPVKCSTPNARSSPREAHKGLAGVRVQETDLSSFPAVNGNLEHSLLEALGDLRVLSRDGDGAVDAPPPLLPEKRKAGECGGDLDSRLPSLTGLDSISLSFSSLTPDPFKGLSGTPSPGAEFGNKQDTVKFVQDTSKFWYKPDISRDQAISVLKDQEPGSFIVRDSHSFRGAYGLAMKVATPPPSALHPSKKIVDPSNELVRHFLIECTQKGVRLKGCPDEPFFGSLTALVCQHSITPLALPCKLILPDRDPLEEMSDSPAKTATNSAAELLKQGAACNVWYLGSVELESLTGQQAVQKATTVTLAMDPPPASTVVHFKVSAQGITLTDNQRKLFFRRHYAVNTVIFCSLDPQGRRWTRGSASTAKIFGFVARKSQSETENICHLFAEHDPEQPASAIVNFVSKVMIGSHKK